MTNSSQPSRPIKAVILAGGSGTRLWPVSRMQLPKQFLRLQGDKTLLDATVHRLSPLIKPCDVLVVTGVELAKGEAFNTLRSYQTLLEPVGRNTAPAIAIAAAWLQAQAEEGEDPIMVVLPADHIIKDSAAFQNALREAVEVASGGRLVTFGIEPTRPDTGFGYIKVAPQGEGGALPVMEFTEKPDGERAEAFIADGSYYWNSGMFVWRVSTILEEVRAYLPEVHELVERMLAEVSSGGQLQKAVDRLFATMPNISIDYGVLEKSRNVALIPCSLGWSDVGSWDAVYELSELDEDGNAVQGHTIVKGCADSLIQSNHRLVAAVGMSGICVVETADAVLIAPRGETQRVREVVDALKAEDAQEYLFHRTVLRPWGSFTVLEEQPGFKMKRISVEPGARLSLQRHQHRSEHWIVVSGTATVIRDGETLTVTKNQSTYIPIGIQHRLENRGKIPLELVEVQVGEYLGEDDIERIEDHYDR